ncbi:30S ribosomal protein S8 [Candidatus Parcubacteria bacterium]|nr:MAG: 30S ribosomal protein S8 [Candidatus Parcubacteria bacterium]
MTDPIADMLTRIRNAQAVSKPELVLPYSNIKFAIGNILKEEGYIKDIDKVESKYGNGWEIKILLKYKPSKKGAITNIKRVSKSGRRVYVTREELPRVLNNLGIAIVSTSKGLMTNKNARKLGLGGEVICEVY